MLHPGVLKPPNTAHLGEGRGVVPTQTMGAALRMCYVCTCVRVLMPTGSALCVCMYRLSRFRAWQ